MSFFVQVNIDKSKIYREIATVKLTTHHKHVQNQENIICIRVNCRVVRHFVMKKELQEKMTKTLRNPKYQNVTCLSIKTGTESRYLILNYS